MVAHVESWHVFFFFFFLNCAEATHLHFAAHQAMAHDQSVGSGRRVEDQSRNRLQRPARGGLLGAKGERC